jgi:hypothetical protein
MVWFGMTRRFRFAYAGFLSSFPQPLLSCPSTASTLDLNQMKPFMSTTNIKVCRPCLSVCSVALLIVLMSLTVLRLGSVMVMLIIPTALLGPRLAECLKSLKNRVLKVQDESEEGLSLDSIELKGKPGYSMQPCSSPFSANNTVTYPSNRSIRHRYPKIRLSSSCRRPYAARRHPCARPTWSNRTGGRRHGQV